MFSRVLIAVVALASVALVSAETCEISDNQLGCPGDYYQCKCDAGLCCPKSHPVCDTSDNTCSAKVPTGLIVGLIVGFIVCVACVCLCSCYFCSCCPWYQSRMRKATPPVAAPVMNPVTAPYPGVGGAYPQNGGAYAAPPAGGYPAAGAYPPAGGAYAPAGGAYPPAGGAYPPAGGAYPPAGGAYPAATTTNTSTKGL